MLSPQFKRLLLAYFGPYYTRLRYPNLFDKVSRVCLFAGHGRSGSTLVGALLNAHPNIVMSNELDLLKYADRRFTQEQLFNMIFYLARRQARMGSEGGGGYKYAVTNQWQGKHQEIRVLGDRKAGATARWIFTNPELMPLLERAIQLPLRFIHVARNPYDVVTTTILRGSPAEGESSGDHLLREIAWYENRCQAVADILDRVGDDHLKIVHHETLVADVRGVLVDLCEFLGVKPNDGYLEACARVVNPSPHVTRTKIDWRPEWIDALAVGVQDFPWLREYSFDTH